MLTGLERIAINKAKHPKSKHNNLICLINKTTLAEISTTFDKNKATGIDKITKEEYHENFDTNINNLIISMKQFGSSLF
jgi:hypothetical protein